MTDKYAVYHRQYYLEHKEKIDGYKRDWRKKHPGYNNSLRRKSYRKNKNILQELKINGCAICGYNKYVGALDFHHANTEDKKFYILVDSVHRKDLANELNKCILLCANCHREIHNKEVKNV